MMTRGDENEGRGLMPGGVVSGHVGDWEELAVDYLDGVLDPSTAAAVETHLRECPACAARLHKQESLVAFLEAVDYEAPPSKLEDRVLGELLFPAGKTRSESHAQTHTESRPLKQLKQQESRWSTIWRRKIVPWVPATIGVVAVLAVVVTYGLVRESADEPTDLAINTTAAQSVSEESADAAGVVAPAPAGAEPTVGAAAEEAAPAGGSARNDVTTTAAPATTMVQEAGTAYVPSAATTVTTAPSTPETSIAVAMAPDTTTVTQNKAAMVTDLKAAGSPVYIVFESEAVGAGVTAQLTALTGLEPLEQSLWIDGPTFAAYVPREQAQQFVDLLLSIGTSTQANVSLAMQPAGAHAGDQGPVTLGGDAFSRLMEKKAEFVELFASRTPQPAVASWSFTTSTLPPISDDGAEAQRQLLPDEAGTHVLVVISIRD